MLGTRTSRQHNVYTVATEDDFFLTTPFYFMIFEILTTLNINGCGFPGFHFVLYGG
jgi:hypothetical protein